MTVTDDFMAALQAAEASGDVSGLVALHAPEVTLRNLTERTWKGQDGAQDFWETYLANFEEIRSEFTRSQEDGGLGVMEWTATGRVKGGREIKYRGVSLIDVQDGQVTAFRTYYDTAAFVVPAAAE
ncbi:nuclear transport factor 2 family protein [Deinococcus taeanensis]|uniref:nuclear transport factor 2 family protein n=1 Tax=Deinococcus taeanensis TaxID=2737050 RepID=UPI001CDCD708|nr:nuclear transport factor 2 family protein [Deinococcus taeanensis]UBV41984.1 nuclear transport factor 2 family protein [Deinococcus taeanensis]